MVRFYTKFVTMRIFFFLLSFLFFIACSSTNEKQAKTEFHTKENKLTLKVNNRLINPEWTLDPSLKPHLFEAECTQTTNIVTFLNATDSISFHLQEGDSIDFSFIYKQDTTHTRIIGIAPNYNFTAAYIKKHKGTTIIDIPEVSELANILMALHRDAEQDNNMIDSSTDYFQSVKAHFTPFLDHPIMDTIQHYIGGLREVDEGVSIFSNESYMYYFAMKMNACTYEFTEDGKIVNQGFIKELAKGWSTLDPFKDKALMEDFAKTSNFRAFYQENKPYYDELLTTYETLNPIGKMQKWLDKKFGFTYGNYSIYFSPLIAGAHSTKAFDTDDFKQTFMFIARADFDDSMTRTMNELVESRVVFTEIDHNYVNPVSVKFLDGINASLSNRDRWVQGEMNDMYADPYMVFNEYMTFAVYSLYIHDNYPEKEVLAYLPKMETQMEQLRGYPQFKAFNRTLLEHYKSNPNQSINELYTFILKWCETVNAS